MEALIEFLPPLAFLVAYMWRGIYATGSLMGATALLLIYDRLCHQQIPQMHLASALLVFALGSATLCRRYERLIIWKPTARFWALALAYLVSMVMRKPLIERLMTAVAAEALLGVPLADWSLITLVWTVCYVVIGILKL